MTWFSKADRVSDRWLAEHAKRGDRIEFHGVAIRWPIKRKLNKLGWLNRELLSVDRHSDQERRRA